MLARRSVALVPRPLWPVLAPDFFDAGGAAEALAGRFL